MAATTQTVNYTLTRGLPWERLIVVKDRNTHRVVKPTDSSSFVKTGDFSKVELTTEVTSENGIKLTLTAEETQDLPLGDLQYDVLATIAGIQRPVSKGIITVSALDNITPMEDTQAMEIRYKQYTDYRRTFTWKDANGDVLTIQSAFMQAKNSSGTTMIDLRWYATKPSESTVIAITPANKRGYLAPAAGATLELHISNANTVAAGSYSFDLFVQDSAGDWDCLSSGTLVVEASVSAPPT
jgi:predicted glutamine amidotransferase